ncbi:expressed unknown protein [Seminavis robusta]|uniref:Transmembrane protein n=1 Tax=Seminavis robusta TaxID=568900 RepID=A0A9N8F4X7_9STRA|nr:expressed unknown protein [Seminavis robusta]|eukprot:Sro3039_g342620.1 n/a (288) ;mRNA; r:4077-4940
MSHNTAPSGHRGSGVSILTRRSSVALRRKEQLHVPVLLDSPDAAVVPATKEEEDPLTGFWIYPELMDILALVAAMSLTVNTTSIFSFTTEDISPADDRYTEFLGSSMFDPLPVSRGLMVFSALGTSLSSLSLVMSVCVRIILTYAVNTNTRSRKRRFLLQWANPMSVFVVIIWNLAIGCSAVTVYFVGWVVFPPEIARSAFLLACGIAFMLGLLLLFVLAVFMVVRSIHLDKEDREEIQRGTSIVRSMMDPSATEQESARQLHGTSTRGFSQRDTTNHQVSASDLSL